MTVDKTFLSGDVVEYSILKFTGEITKVHFKKDGSIDLLEVCVLRSDNHKIFQHSTEFISSKNFGKDYKNIKIVPSDSTNLNYKDHDEVDNIVKVFTERAISREREYKIDAALKNRDKELFDKLTGGGQL